MARVEFRDGTREIPDWQAEIMAGIETMTMTFQEAIAAANKKMEADFINRHYDKVVEKHFRDLRGR